MKVGWVPDSASKNLDLEPGAQFLFRCETGTEIFFLINIFFKKLIEKKVTRINGTRLGAERNSNHNFLWGEETDPERGSWFHLTVELEPNPRQF
jgi:hypothetical protein